MMPKILTAVIGNAAPDILWFNPQITGQLVELQAIRPIENWLDSSPLKAEIDPALIEAMVLDSHTWSIPFTTNNAGIFYRPSLFKAAGIAKLPETWEELRSVAHKLTLDKNGDGRKDQHGILLSLGKGEWTVFTWLPFMFSAGGELVQGNQPTLMNKGAIAALDLWSNLLKDGSAINSLPERGYEQDDFIAGRVAMQITGPWTLGYLVPSGIDFGVLPFPTDKQHAAVVGGENLFVMKTTPEHEQATLKFLEYVLSEDFQTELAINTGSLPINLKSRQSKAFQYFLTKQPALKVFLEQMAWARSRPIIPGYNRLSESLGRAIEASLLGESPELALQQAQERLKLFWDQ
jgi:multiple sugar transport system substrate-binding protein